MKKLLILVAAMLMCLCAFAGCTDGGKGQGTADTDKTSDDNIVKYNAVLYDNAEEWIDEDFRSNNRISGVYYQDGNYVTATEKERTFFVNSAEEYATIFAENNTELKVDFEKDMLIVYTFSIEYRLPVEISDINLADKTLSVNYKIKFPATDENVGNACQPYQRWAVLKMDKSDIDSAEFKYKRG